MDKAKQVVALVGGFLSAIFLFLQTVGVAFDWYNPESIDAFVALLAAGVPLAFALYGIYKNSYLMSEKARKQEAELKRRGLK